MAPTWDTDCPHEPVVLGREEASDGITYRAPRAREPRVLHPAPGSESGMAGP